jgi:hypothetical protein
MRWLTIFLAFGAISAADADITVSTGFEAVDPACGGHCNGLHVGLCEFHLCIGRPSVLGKRERPGRYRPLRGWCELGSGSKARRIPT